MVTPVSASNDILSQSAEDFQYWKSSVLELGLKLSEDPAKYKETVIDFYNRFNKLVQASGFSTAEQQLYSQYQANLAAVKDNKELRNRVMDGDKTRDIFFYLSLVCPHSISPIQRGEVIEQAVRVGRLDVVQRALKIVPHRLKDSDRVEALAVAIEKGSDMNVVQELLQNGPLSIMNIDERGRILLMAADKGRLDIVQVLMRDGVIHEEDRDRAVLKAAEKGRPDIVQELIQWGSIREEISRQAALKAPDKCRSDIMQILILNRLVSGDDYVHGFLFAAENNLFPMFQERLKNKEMISDDVCKQAFLIASKKGHLNIIKELLDKKRHLNQAIIQRAVVEAAREGHSTVVEYLCQLHIDKGFGRYMIDAESWCAAFSAAAEAGHLQTTCHSLLKNRLIDGVGKSVVMGPILKWAAEKDRLTAVQMILSYGRITEEDRGCALKASIAQNIDRRIIQELLKNGPVSLADRESAIAKAISINQRDIVNMLKAEWQYSDYLPGLINHLFW
jgi:ankyrin repeat protein